MRLETRYAISALRKANWLPCYRLQRSWAKVMFLQVCVILLTGWGCLPQCMLGYHTTLGSRHPPPLGADTPPEQTPSGADTPPPPRHTVNERPVRILLKCILVVTLLTLLLLRL